jgi:hypothetical protein
MGVNYLWLTLVWPLAVPSFGGILRGGEGLHRSFYPRLNIQLPADRLA